MSSAGRGRHLRASRALRLLRGFSLVEIMVVIGILALLIAISFANYRHSIGERRLESDYRQLHAFLKLAHDNSVAAGGGQLVVTFAHPTSDASNKVSCDQWEISPYPTVAGVTESVTRVDHFDSQDGVTADVQANGVSVSTQKVSVLPSPFDSQDVQVLAFDPNGTIESTPLAGSVTALSTPATLKVSSQDVTDTYTLTLDPVTGGVLLTQ